MQKIIGKHKDLGNQSGDNGKTDTVQVFGDVAMLHNVTTPLTERI